MKVHPNSHMASYMLERQRYFENVLCTEQNEYHYDSILRLPEGLDQLHFIAVPYRNQALVE